MLKLQILLVLLGIFILTSSAPNPQAPAPTTTVATPTVTAPGGTQACTRNRGKREQAGQQDGIPSIYSHAIPVTDEVAFVYTDGNKNTNAVRTNRKLQSPATTSPGVNQPTPSEEDSPTSPSSVSFQMSSENGISTNSNNTRTKRQTPAENPTTNFCTELENALNGFGINSATIPNFKSILNNCCQYFEIFTTTIINFLENLEEKVKGLRTVPSLLGKFASDITAAVKTQA